jgi:arylsulfatase A-like enzyme
MQKNNIIILAIINSAALATSCSSPAEKSETKAPNIIYILADDLGYGDVSFLGQNNFDTPNIDRLSRSGMVFTQHYSGSTVCAPSRSALLTGQHTGHTPIRGNKEIQPEGQHPMPAESFTMAEMLKESGYATGVFGKWGLGYPGSEGDPNNQGFDEFYGYNCQRLAHHYYPWHLWHNQEKIMLPGNEGKQQNEYAPAIIHDRALSFMEENRDQPFFLFYASPLPHAELLVPEEELEPFKGQFLPEIQYKGTDDGPDYRLGPYGSQENAHAAFVAMVTILDRQVGEILDKVEELGIEENTIIMFTSDNGPHQEGGADPDYFDSNGCFTGYKRDLYEGGIHVPMIASWPGTIEAGTVTDHISAFWDVMPTVADITGHSIAETIDGISFLPTLTQSGEQKKHDYLYWEFHEKGGRIAIRQGKWKAVKYNVLENPDAPVQLFDLSIDPREQNNLATVFPDKANELSQLMAQARTPSDVFTFDATTFLQID